MTIKKALKILILIIFSVCMLVAVKMAQPPQTKLITAFVPKNPESEYISKLSEISGSKLNIIIETENLNKNLEIKDALEAKLSELNTESPEIQKVLEVYKNYPGNFLSPETEKLLRQRKYAQLEQKSLETLYSPLGFYVATPDVDPYLFATLFVKSNQKFLTEAPVFKAKKVYSLIRFNCSKMSDVETVKSAAEELSKDSGVQIYLSGTPIHTFETQKRSNIEINVICVLSVLFVILLCNRSFKSCKILIPVLISIFFGFLSGFTFCTLFFKQLHILTFVFSTSLIGIGLDYSLHYYLSGQNPKFKKSLFISMFSTVLMFLLLAFSNVEILKQIAVFVSSGLFGIYLFVALYLPALTNFLKINTDSAQGFDIQPNENFKPSFLTLICVVIFLGIFNLHFDDSIKSLYKPAKTLLKAERTFRSVFGENSLNFIIVKGENPDEILQKEETITKSLYRNGTNFIALSNFVSSTKKQARNLSLVSSLYKSRLNSYATFLDAKTRKNLLRRGKIYNPNDFPLNDTFLLNKNTSYIAVFGEVKSFDTLNVADEITKTIRDFRHKCLFFIPVMFAFLFAALKFFYTAKVATKLILPSFLGGAFALSLLCLLRINLNVFHLLAFILALGFSMDYSIFRLQGDKRSNLAILISCASTVFSFLLLSFTSFRLISSLGVVLSIGVLASYILSKLLISPNETENI